MNMIGVIEGFFGPQWPESNRKSFSHFLHLYGGDFYIYAPKQDPFLRKRWRENWTPEYLEFLSDLINTFKKNGIKFGVGFSPFGLGMQLTNEDKAFLSQKIQLLDKLGIDMLGLFFDDMPTNENLAETQIEALDIVQRNFSQKIIFCPSYYTPDPILDKVFGPRPVDYLEKIGRMVPQDVSIAWTGPKVISPEINREHLEETAIILKRKPFIWENLFANDGPKNCKFLKLKPFIGRSQEAFLVSEAFGLNLMNQPELSKILFLSAKLSLEGKADPELAFHEALTILCTSGFVTFLEKNQLLFLSSGLDKINENENEKEMLLNELQNYSDPAAIEIRDWLEGKYLVGSECLTD